MAEDAGVVVGTPPAGIEGGPVARWLSAEVDGAVPPFRFDMVSGGRSNLTYRVTGADGRSYALRRPPLGQVLATAHDMAREYRIITALWGSAVPVAQTFGLCEDNAVNGAPFYVMDFVEGTVAHDIEVAATIPVEQRQAASAHLVEVLAALHEVDVDGVGLGTLAKKEDYVARQLKRWTRQYEQSKDRDLPLMDRVRDGLAARVPEQEGAGIVHGDYRIGNVMLDATGHIAAVLDWELCTLGDVRADVGHMCSYWADEGEDDKLPTAAGGWWTRAQVAEVYAERTGTDLADLDWFTAFAHWRLACIAQGVYARYKGGSMGEQDDIDLDEMAEGVTNRLEKAAELT
ncbi:MAG: phosphotransferase family protein [Actinomycetia bacterium]|nr:phosphotransferase family protein [Actinomycetes bacterium]MCP3911146.1 phosphotransferase family protein [Actinomycetes bacterium]MCP4086918.1 phosphotransferase family protein [Actinomycetes bacterium]